MCEALEGQPCDANEAHQALLLQLLQCRQRLIDDLGGGGRHTQGRVQGDGGRGQHGVSTRMLSCRDCLDCCLSAVPRMSHRQRAPPKKDPLPLPLSSHLVEGGKLNVVALDEVDVGHLQPLQGLCHAARHPLSTEVKQLRPVAPNLCVSARTRMCVWGGARRSRQGAK